MPVSGIDRSGPSGGRGLVFVLLAVLLAFGFARPAIAQDGANLRDGGFENFPMTEAWRPVPGDFDVVLDTRSPYEDQGSLRLDRDATASSPFAAVAQALDATPYRGRTIRFRAAARAAPGRAPGPTAAGLFLAQDRPRGRRPGLLRQYERPADSLAGMDRL